MTCVCDACIAETNRCKCWDLLCTNPRCDAKTNDDGQCSWLKAAGHQRKPWHEQYCKDCWKHHFPAEWPAWPKPKAAAPGLAAEGAAGKGAAEGKGKAGKGAAEGAEGKGAAGKGYWITEQITYCNEQITEQTQQIIEQNGQMAEQILVSGQHSESIQLLENRVHTLEQEIWQLREDMKQIVYQ
jgi:hypothetical protein